MLKAIVLDIEISPHLTYTYDTYEADVVKMVRPQFLLSFAWKELGSKKVTVVALPDFKDHYRKKPYSDELLCRELRDVIDRYPVIIGHNFKRFDIRKIYARFMYWGIKPPAHPLIIDTLTIARQVADFPGNSLAKLADFLHVPQPKLHFGIDEWIACIEGDDKAWTREKRYNGRDILVNEQIYYLLRPFMRTHPNMNADDGTKGCHACGSTSLMKKGRRYSAAGWRQRYECKSCGIGNSEKTLQAVTVIRS